METFFELRLLIKGVECNFSLNRTPSNGFQISFGRKSFSLEADFCLDLRRFYFLSCWLFLFMPIKGRWDDWCLISSVIWLGLDEIRRTDCCVLVGSPHNVILKCDFWGQKKEPNFRKREWWNLTHCYSVVCDNTTDDWVIIEHGSPLTYQVLLRKATFAQEQVEEKK